MQGSVTSNAQSEGDAGRRTRNWPIFILIGLLIFALVVGLVSIAAFFVLRDQQAEGWTWQDPTTAVDSTRVRPDIAVLTLLDEAPGTLIWEALEAGEPDTAYAILAYSSVLSDAERAGDLQALAKEFETAGALDLVALAYQQMHTLAALSPALPDITRAEASLAAAEGFLGLDMAETARPSLDQAETLARYSPLLAPVQRQEIARRLLRLYEEAGFEREAQYIGDLIRQPVGLPDARLVQGPFLPSFRQTVPEPRHLLDTINERHQLVYRFLQAWDSGDSGQIEGARAALARALIAEDGLRQALYDENLEASLLLSQKAGVVLGYLNWLALKSMIANGALGISLVPEWESQSETIAARQGEVYGFLNVLYRDQVAILPSSSESAFARVEIARLQNLVGRLGLDPGYNVEGMALSMEDVQRTISDQLALLIIDEPWGSGIIFRLAESFE
ncbi:MAG: hypothetical protein U9R25_19575 [Chloroflexota bacterium]|nr:hypothetical protein [Chloroflexota bacterium]